MSCTQLLAVVLLAVGGVVAADCGLEVAADDPAAPMVRRLLAERRHPDLRWPDIADFAAAAQRVYEERSYRLLWSHAGKLLPQVDDILAELARAGDRGLSAADYDAEWLSSAVRESLVGDAARFDVALTIAVMRFASALHQGRLGPAHVGYAMDLWHDDLDVAAFTGRLATSLRPADTFAAIEPRSPIYENLVAALRRLRGIDDFGTHAALASIAKLRPGDVDGGVAALRARLVVTGDLADSGGTGADIYDDEMVFAVRRFQKRHGLEVDGIVGERTLAQLRVPTRDRVRQIEMSLERVRWLPDEPESRLLLVNIPEFRLHAFDPGSWQPVLQMNVVVGAAVRRTTTSVFRAEMKYVEFRPYWNVPRSIARGEMLPKIERQPDYLRSKNLEVVGGAGDSLSAATLSSGSVRLRQRPGPNNALGLVKFIFPNRFNIYMHDTPEKSLFRYSRRDFSHGCVRLEDPAALAAYLLAEQGWDRERVEQAMNGERTFQVNLTSPTSVQIFYVTAVADQDGEMYFYEDIYGHDAALSRQLDAGYPYRKGP